MIRNFALAGLVVLGSHAAGGWPALGPYTPTFHFGERTSKPSKTAARPVLLEELPDPRPQAPPDDDYRDFADYALAQAASGPSGYRSAVIAPETLSVIPAPTSCAGKAPAVAIDLDVGDRDFDVTDPPLALGGLAGQLERLRKAGIAVLWITGAPPAVRKKLKVILAATALDEAGSDHLLTTPSKERKQATRLAAAREWCIIAIAGDQMSDFEEAYDFLRDANGPVGSILRLNINNGWFLKAAPIQ